ncbi:MAG: NAD(P)-binding domain-containing protein [Steroidobacteraceae bacterium]
MRIGVLGSGIVGTTLAGGFLAHGHEVMIGSREPVNGVLRFFTSLDDSLMERLQKEFPQIRFVKAFNSVGSARMVNPAYAQGGGISGHTPSSS